MCPYRAFRKGLLDHHMAVHAKNGFVKKCHLCDSVFAYRHQQLDHMKTAHGTSKIYKYMCDKCRYATDVKKYLLRDG